MHFLGAFPNVRQPRFRLTGNWTATINGIIPNRGESNERNNQGAPRSSSVWLAALYLRGHCVAEGMKGFSLHSTTLAPSVLSLLDMSYPDVSHDSPAYERVKWKCKHAFMLEMKREELMATLKKAIQPLLWCPEREGVKGDRLGEKTASKQQRLKLQRREGGHAD